MAPGVVAVFANLSRIAPGAGPSRKVALKMVFFLKSQVPTFDPIDEENLESRISEVSRWMPFALNQANTLTRYVVIHDWTLDKSKTKAETKTKKANAESKTKTRTKAKAKTYLQVLKKLERHIAMLMKSDGVLNEFTIASSGTCAHKEALDLIQEAKRCISLALIADSLDAVRKIRFHDVRRLIRRLNSESAKASASASASASEKATVAAETLREKSGKALTMPPATPLETSKLVYPTEPNRDDQKQSDTQKQGRKRKTPKRTPPDGPVPPDGFWLNGVDVWKLAEDWQKVLTFVWERSENPPKWQDVATHLGVSEQRPKKVLRI